MTQALLITAYKNFNQLIELADYFDKGFEIYIHIDNKQTISSEYLQKLHSFSQVKLVSFKHKVNYAGRNHLKSILHLSEEALKNKNNYYFHVISGQDFPVQPLSYYFEFAQKNKETNFLEYFEMPNPQWENGGMDRLELFSFYDLLDAKKQLRIIHKLNRIQKKTGFKRKLNINNQQLFGGSTWWSLNQQTLQYVIDYTNQHPNLLRRMKHTFCSEEIYFQTVIMNSPFASSVINNCLRYINWNLKHNSIPAILDQDDLSNIKVGNYLFARKFDSPYSDELKLNLIKSDKRN